MRVLEKPCSKCKEVKPLIEFSRQKGRKYGVSSQCRECSSSRNKAHYQENKDKILAKHKEYYDNNTEKFAELNKKWNDTHKDYVKARSAKYYQENTDRINSKNAEWREKFPEKEKAREYANRKLGSRDGCHKHHWSYNEEHWLDVIELTISEHRKLHTVMSYNPTEKKYECENGTLLDSREKHGEYMVKMIMRFRQ